MNEAPQHIGARICIIRYPDETTICANIQGFRLLGERIAWLVSSNPSEKFHFHLLWQLTAEAPAVGPGGETSVWVLTQSEPVDGPATMKARGTVPEFELTFQVVDESDLNELAAFQASGQVPPRFRKHVSAVDVTCV